MTKQRRSGARRERVFQGFLLNLLTLLVQKYKYDTFLAAQGREERVGGGETYSVYLLY